MLSTALLANCVPAPPPVAMAPRVDSPMPFAGESGALMKQAMRHLAGGVVVVTAGTGAERVGLTATSATSFSVEPPTMLVCVNRASSTWPVIARQRHFCISILGAAHRPVAERFAGIGQLRGADRYLGAHWTPMASGASGLTDAQALIDCEVEEIIERHSHAILLGAVRSIRINPMETDLLVYGRGAFAEVAMP